MDLLGGDWVGGMWHRERGGLELGVALWVSPLNREAELHLDETPGRYHWEGGWRVIPLPIYKRACG